MFLRYFLNVIAVWQPSDLLIAQIKLIHGVTCTDNRSNVGYNTFLTGIYNCTTLKLQTTQFQRAPLVLLHPHFNSRTFI